jgi:oxygen-dependent protoporphyrinogen oxidase
MDCEIAVVGGGIAGLACAWRLQRAGREVLLLEAGARAGGNIQTHQRDGFCFERGPHTFMASAADVFSLIEEVGLDDALVATLPAAGDRFIVRGGRLHRAPTGLGSFLATRLLSWRAKWKLAGEPLRTRRRGDPGESAADFFARRFGPEAGRVLAGAFIAGVYAGDPEQLSAPAAFPLFWRFEQERGSMIRGALALKRERRAERRRGGAAARRPRRGLFSLAGGLGRLSQGVAEKLGPALRTDAAVEALAREGGGYRIEGAAGTLHSRRLVLAVPPPQAARLAGMLDAELAEPLAGVPMAPVAVVHLGFAERQPAVPDGFGFLAPRGEGVRTLGVLFPSRLFADRTPPGGDLFSGFVGGMLDREALALDDAALVSIVRDDLQRLTGLEQPPQWIEVARYPQAIPQLTLGHLERMERVRQRLGASPGLALAGNYLRGVGVKDAVGAGFAAAQALVGPSQVEGRA